MKTELDFLLDPTLQPPIGNHTKLYKSMVNHLHAYIKDSIKTCGSDIVDDARVTLVLTEICEDIRNSIDTGSHKFTNS